MNGYVGKMTGWLVLWLAIIGLLAAASLVAFFVGSAALAFTGGLTDVLNGVAGFLSAVLASVLYPALRRLIPRPSLVLLIGVWAGAIAIAFGSWLILTGRSGVELSSYYGFLGNGLIGIWLWVLNRVARREGFWPRNLSLFGLIVAAFMLVGLLGLYGVLLQSDGRDFAPLVMAAGISYLGWGILYPIWCLLLGWWTLARQKESAIPAQ